jgi:hypothetical protein
VLISNISGSRRYRVDGDPNQIEGCQIGAKGDAFDNQLGQRFSSRRCVEDAPDVMPGGHVGAAVCGTFPMWVRHLAIFARALRDHGDKCIAGDSAASTFGILMSLGVEVNVPTCPRAQHRMKRFQWLTILLSSPCLDPKRPRLEPSAPAPIGNENGRTESPLPCQITSLHLPNY